MKTHASLLTLAVATLPFFACQSHKVPGMPTGDAVIEPAAAPSTGSEMTLRAQRPAVVDVPSAQDRADNDMRGRRPMFKDVAKAEQMPWEFTIGGAGISDDEFDVGGAQIAGRIGYYFDEMFQVSFRQNVGFSDAGSGSPDLWNGVSRIALDAHFPLGAFVPFVGASGGVVYGDSVNEQMILGPEGGVKVYFKEDVFLEGLVEYQFFLDDDDNVGDAFEDGQVVFGIGLGLRF